MITMYVTYAGSADTPFDREHWINVHFPLVLECWGPYGLERLAGFFPQQRISWSVYSTAAGALVSG
jgi:hypothetical protein